MDALAEAFAPVYGTPSWGVKRGVGSCVTLDFGTPRVEIDDVRTLLANIGPERMRVPRRIVQVKGEWSLWFYWCDWSLSWNDREIANSESEDLVIDRALHVLNGQSLTAVSAGAGDGTSTFSFDLSCTLQTRPALPEDYAEDDPQREWMFFQPSGRVLSLYADGRLRTTDSDEP
jgi:hypothetical protein